MTSTTSEILVRDASVAERDAVAALTLAVYEQFSATMPPAIWQEYTASIRDTLSNDTTGTRIVALQDNVIIGSALLFPPAAGGSRSEVEQPYPEIRLVAVAPQARRRGIATALVNTCISRTRAAGYTDIGLHSTEFMADAIRIYVRMGFVRAPEHDFPVPGGVVMGFRLSLDALPLADNADLIIHQ